MSENSNAIAIVGVSLRFPRANTPAEFWNNLVQGRDCAKMLDKEELRRVGVARDRLDSPEYVYRSYDLDDIDLFDARFFGLSPREARMADPQLRIMLEAAQECIEDSGHVLQGTNTGMYVGVADHKYWLYYNLYQSALEEQNEVAKRILMVKDFFATQLSHKLGLNGPSIALNSACSTGLLATHEACNHLLMYDCDYAIAGGCEILNGVGYKYLDGGLSSRDGYLRAFDKDASGTVFGSGVGMVMLRRLADAQEDGDKIYAVIRSTAVNNDGNQKVGYMAPGVVGQMGVIHEAIERAGISARDISYVEAHGTGTPVGDPIEIESISRVYRKYTDANQFCAIGSVKTNVGHLSIAAGIAGLIKTALMLHHRKIPPILHFNEANPAIRFEESPFYIARELADWTPINGRRIAGVSAFGVGGTNAHAIMEEAPEPLRSVEPRPCHKLFLLSAKSENALSDVRQRLGAHVRSEPDIEPADIAVSLNVGRQKYDHRTFVVAGSREQLVEALDASPHGFHRIPPTADRQPVFMFPGQGSQYPDMCLGLYQLEPVFKRHVDECCESGKRLGIDVFSVLFPSLAGTGDAARDQIHQTQFTQISLFTISYSLAQLWMHWGVKPAAMIGHSIGEYAAACIAGVFDLDDALKLVANRGRLMQSMPSGSMLSVPLPREELAAFLDADQSIAGENSPASCVVSGTAEAIERLAGKLLRSDVKSTVLKTSHAFHSHMMDPILEAYKQVVREVQLRAPTLPFISNVTGAPITAEQAVDPGYWTAQLRQPVLFSRGLQSIAAPDLVFLEIGPGSTLCSLVGQHDFDHECLSISTQPRAKDGVGADDFILTALGKAFSYGLEVDWEAVCGKAGARRVSLPTYPFERKSFWIDDELLNAPRSFGVDELPIEHPLLGRTIALSPKVVVFENIIDAQTPAFIADHRLVETVIFPGAGYTQMGLEIGRHFIKNKRPRIDEIRFAQVMMLHEGARKVVQVIATASGEGCTFEILSRDLGKSDAKDSSAWVLHAKGKVSPHSAAPPLTSMPALISNPANELLPLSRYYDALKFITFGPSFRAIKRLWIGENDRGELESVGLIELPQHLYPEVDSYSFHPVLLDAAFQVIDGPKMSETGTLPVGLRNFTVYGPVPNSFYVHAIRRESVDEEYSIGEITVFSPDGVVIARIGHYLQKEIADSIDSEDRLADVLFSVGWQKVEQEIVNDVPARNAWLILGDGHPFCTELANVLAQSGKYVIAAPAAGVPGEALELLQRSQLDTVVFAGALDTTAQKDAMALSLELLGVVQKLGSCESDAPPRIAIVTSGAQGLQAGASDTEAVADQAVLWGIGNTITVEHPEYRCLRADIDDQDASRTSLISDLVLGHTRENELVYRLGQRWSPRLKRYSDGDHAKKLRLPSGPFEVRLMRFGTFENFAIREFVPDLLAENEVLVEMQSVALNFKETLYVLGFLNPNNRQAAAFDFGMEGAGRIKRVGSRVTHLKIGDEVIVWHNGCLTSDFVVNVERVIRKPQCLSYAEAACIPTVFMTAYHALYHLANIQRGSRVLIHAAAGGVGQVSIQIAKAAGAEIYATASQGKWEHLRSQGVEHIFDSRTLDFSQQILDATGGKGVDIVFNSLSGDFISRSFDALRQGGCFVEIGKKEIWSVEEAARYRPDVDYQVFEIGEDRVSGGIGGEGVIHDLMVRILEDFETGRLVPLPMREFETAEIQQAYRHLSTGRNIGKVVVNFERRQADASASVVSPDKTYLVTGGLGGLGFLCAQWLVAQGARHLVLTGRSQPAEAAASKIRDLGKLGVDIQVMCGDISQLDDARNIVSTIAGSGAPLGGILHCAGVLDDALIQQQSLATFQKVFKPKVMGTLNLHHLTSAMALDFFVCFSSVSAILDGGGQSNYAAANAFMDRLMSFRRSRDLPGLSINWGAWADVGMAAQLSEKRAMDTSHFITTDEGLQSLERLLLNGDSQGVVCRIGNRLAFENKSRMLLDLADQQGGQDDVDDLTRVFMKHPEWRPEQNLEAFLKIQVNKVLGAEAANEVDVDVEFVSLGVDSLSMTELKNAVQHGMGKSLKMATFFANPTVSRLARHLAREFADQLPVVGAARAAVSDAQGKVEDAQSIEFVTLEEAPGKKAIFCFPGLNGNIFDFTDFVAQGKTRYQVLVAEINNDAASLETDIQKLAAEAIACIRRSQPSGPYALLGYSYGGVVALEVAHQLRQAGDEVDMLMMVDSFPHFDFRQDGRFMNFMSALITDSILAPMKLDAATYDRLATEIMTVPGSQLRETLQLLGEGGDSASAKVNLDLLNAIVDAGKKRSLAIYAPPRQVEGVGIVYVRAGSYPRSMSLTDLAGFLDEPAMCDQTYGWQHFVDNTFDVRRIDAQHNEILKSHNAGTIIGFVDEVIGATCELT